MRQYIDIVKKVLNEGKVKRPVRRNVSTGKWEPVDGGVSTLACPNVLFSHDMKDGFPLLTTKKVAFKSVCVELEGFIKGITSKKWYRDRKCKIWNEWANPEAVKQRRELNQKKWTDTSDGSQFFCEEQYLDLKGYTEWDYIKELQLEEDDLGPVYGYQWRNFNKAYDENDDGWADESLANEADQLKTIVETLRNNPMDRRMVCSAWNPLQMKKMALPPCHWGWDVTVIGDEINLFWVQRSCDLMLGVPFNIASYALLMVLLAADSGFKPGNLSGMLVDCHIYENQIEGAKEQIARTPRVLPQVSPKIVSDEKFDIFKWTYDQVDVYNYNPHEPIKFGDVIV